MPFIEQQLTADGVTEEGRHIVTEALYEIITNDHVSSMAVNVASPESSGYAVGDTFRIDAGTPVTVNGDDFHATGRVTALGSPETDGRVIAVEIISWGAYTALPSMSPISSPEGTVLGIPTVTLTGAGDDNLVLDITTDTTKWTSDVYTPGSPFLPEWLVSSTKAANGPTIGARSQLSGAFDGLRFTIGSSYSGILPWESQPGVPPTMTFYIGVPNQNPKIYVSTTERRVNMLVTDGTSKQYMGMGLFIPFTDVASNYPFPAIIHAQATTLQSHNTVFSSSNRGIVNPINFSGLGCYQYRDNLSSVWYGMTEDNDQGANVCRAQIWPNQGVMTNWSFNYAPIPTGSSAISSDMLPYSGQNLNLCFEEGRYFTSDQISSIGPAGPQPLGIGNQLHFTVQAHIISNQSGDAQMIGYVDGFEAVIGRGLTAFDEIQNQNGRRYIVFNDTQSTDLMNWVAMEMN
jgi:hypothetical protein